MAVLPQTLDEPWWVDGPYSLTVLILRVQVRMPRSSTSEVSTSSTRPRVEPKAAHIQVFATAVAAWPPIGLNMRAVSTASMPYVEAPSFLLARPDGGCGWRLREPHDGGGALRSHCLKRGVVQLGGRRRLLQAIRRVGVSLKDIRAARGELLDPTSARDVRLDATRLKDGAFVSLVHGETDQAQAMREWAFMVSSPQCTPRCSSASPRGWRAATSTCPAGMSSTRTWRESHGGRAARTER